MTPILSPSDSIPFIPSHPFSTFLLSSPCSFLSFTSIFLLRSLPPPSHSLPLPSIPLSPDHVLLWTSESFARKNCYRWGRGSGEKRRDKRVCGGGAGSEATAGGPPWPDQGEVGTHSPQWLRDEEAAERTDVSRTQGRRPGAQNPNPDERVEGCGAAGKRLLGQFFAELFTWNGPTRDKR